MIELKKHCAVIPDAGKVVGKALDGPEFEVVVDGFQELVEDHAGESLGLKL
jgi:hypothetical protein